MSYGVFAADVLVSLLLSGWLLFSYGNWFRHRLVVTLSVLIAWEFSFLIIFVLPLDVSSTAYKHCVNDLNNTVAVNSTSSYANKSLAARNSMGYENATTEEKVKETKCEEPYSLLPDSVLPSLWRVVYWSSQLLTWLVLPLMQSYTQAGEFTAWGKLRSSLWDNVIYYTSYIFIALILLIYISLQPGLHLNWERLKAIAASASNTWGLFFLVLMLGYGLIEVPRSLWNSAENGYLLNKAYFEVAKLMTERSDAEESLDEVLVSVNIISEIISTSDPLRPFVDEILQKIPLEFMEKIRRRRIESAFDNDPPSEKGLIRLHRNVIRSLQNYNRTEAQWLDKTNRVFELEDINRNMISNEHVFKHNISRPPTHILSRTIYNPTVEWYDKCLIRPLTLRFAAGLSALMSFMLIWSEVTFFITSIPLSIFALIVSVATDNSNYFLLEMVCFVTICYLCLCTYYTVFKIRVLNYYYLANNHQSDEYTLLFSGALLCRLTPPLCLNFLSLIHMDSHVIKSQTMETAYTQVMGHMDLVSIVSDYFNVYFPIALLAFCAATYFSLGTRCLTGLGFQQFLDQDSEVTIEMVDEGKEHVKRENRRIERLKESASRRRDFSARFTFNSNEETMEGGDISRGSSENIVKPRVPRQQLTSPERSLLPYSDTVISGDSFNVSSLIPVDEDNSSSSITVPKRSTEPPRNIFDDL